MKHNYHTHTVRCGHACGTEREYIDTAVSRGLETLGFSDHAPYVFEGDYYSGFRMRPERLPEYCETLRALKAEYEGKIDIKLGLEAEYYPKFFDKFLALVEPFKLDYIILGQHFLDNELEGRYSGEPTQDKTRLTDYNDQLIEAMKTGKFTYIAHPDLLRFEGDESFYREESARLCEAAVEYNTPLELNQLGILDHRHYPNRVFWEVAAKSGCVMVTGCDAHDPRWVADPEILKNTYAFAESCGVTLQDGGFELKMV